MVDYKQPRLFREASLFHVDFELLHVENAEWKWRLG